MNFEDILYWLLLLVLLHECINCLNKLPNRRFWVRPLYQTRDVDGLYAISFEHLYKVDQEQFFIMVRMTPNVFDYLFEMVRERLTKHSNRPVVSAKCRLFLVLIYLAHGDSTQFLSLSFKMGASTVRKIIRDTCEVLWNTLYPIYLPIPSCADWLKIADDFNKLWQFPNCVGSIDGKHINMFCPPNSGSQYFNYKGTFSICLLGVCDAKYIFTAVDIGAYGSQSDGGVFANTEFGKRLNNNLLDLPDSAPLPNTNDNFPYIFVGDAAFHLKNNLMRPYPGSLLPADREQFNKRLSRARRTIENTFGILAARWRVLLSPLHMHPEAAESVVKATVVLHNFLRINDAKYCPPDFVDSYKDGRRIDGLWRSEVEPLQKCKIHAGKNAPKKAFQIRDTLKEYINNN